MIVVSDTWPINTINGCKRHIRVISERCHNLEHLSRVINYYTGCIIFDCDMFIVQATDVSKEKVIFLFQQIIIFFKLLPSVCASAAPQLLSRSPTALSGCKSSFMYIGKVFGKMVMTVSVLAFASLFGTTQIGRHNTQHDDTQHKAFSVNDPWHNNILPLCWV